LVYGVVRRKVAALRTEAQATTHSSRAPDYPVWSYVLLDVDTELGREDRARATFERLAIEGFPLRMGAPAAREAGDRGQVAELLTSAAGSAGELGMRSQAVKVFSLG
jgi:hypothetical protein